MKNRILLINGPNLDLLGLREPEVYGRETLRDLCRELEVTAQDLGLEFDHFQSNHEGQLIDCIHKAKQDGVSWIIINPGGLTHTSVVLRDALLGVSIPFIEVHISNIYAREEFRKKSVLSDVASGFLCGFGTTGYQLALHACSVQLKKKG